LFCIALILSLLELKLKFIFLPPIEMKYLKALLWGLNASFGKYKEVFMAFLKIPQFIFDFIKALCKLKWRRSKKECHCPGEVDLPSSIHKRADPLIYDQYYLMGMGLAVTWDNPDIELFENGIQIPSSDLKQNTEYEVRVRVWNNSYDAPAIGLPVHLSFLSFGVQTTSTYLGKTFIDLGAKGTSQCPAFASFKWKTPEQGHYCLQAHLVWADDANPNNNLGQENTNVGVLHSPALFTFRCKNIASTTQRFVFEVDDYQIPALDECPEPFIVGNHERKVVKSETRFQESQRHWAKALKKQSYGQFFNLPDWDIQILPEKNILVGDEEIEVKVSIEPKFDGFKGSKPFNVHAFTVDETGLKQLKGGVTLIVKK
jgi:hypothetical protein